VEVNDAASETVRRSSVGWALAALTLVLGRGALGLDA